MKTGWSGSGTVIIVGLVAAVALSGVTASQGASYARAGTATASARAKAQALTPSAAAKAAGKRVLVASLTTANSETYANPNGSYTLEESVLPVRKRTASGAWAPISSATPQQAAATAAASPALSPALGGPLVAVV